MPSLDKLIAAIAYCTDPNHNTDNYDECLYEECPYAEVAKNDGDDFSGVCMDCLLRDALDKLMENDQEIKKLKKDRMEIGKLVLRLSGVEDD